MSNFLNHTFIVKLKKEWMLVTLTHTYTHTHIPQCISPRIIANEEVFLFPYKMAWFFPCTRIKDLYDLTKHCCIMKDFRALLTDVFSLFLVRIASDPAVLSVSVASRLLVIDLLLSFSNIFGLLLSIYIRLLEKTCISYRNASRFYRNLLFSYDAILESTRCTVRYL